MLSLMRKQWIELYSNKKYIAIIVSIIVLLVIGTIYSMGDMIIQKPPQYTLGIIDEDKNTMSKMLVSYFKDDETFTSYLNVVEGNKKEIEKQFKQGKLLVYLEIPNHFIKNMVHLESQSLKVRIHATNSTDIIIIQNILKSYEKYIMAVEKNVVTLYNMMEEKGMSQTTIDKANYQISFDLVMTALGRNQFFDFHQVKDNKNTGILSYYMYVCLAMIISYFAIFVGMSFMRERNLGIINRYLASGNKMLTFMLGKITFVLSVVSISLIVCSLITHISMNKSIFHSFHKEILILFMILTFLIFLLGFYFLISSVVSSRQNYLLISNALCLVLLIVGGGIIPIKFIPDNLAKLSGLTPNYWFVRGMIMIEKSNDIINVIPIMLSFLILGLLTLLLSSLIYQSIGEKSWRITSLYALFHKLSKEKDGGKYE
ncbi:ABC transporter permease [Anaeromicropila herbilytica]|uniref:ABC-2 type transporter transmembrane domain-containing protein n=1 Tax=Anaeromicropila herbilytica TaxID=2785025 RepID=A0A7R7EKC5_9FIRM|nr:ABC transporter permease [Anaeromicropila herbilytica]BCN30461.1 hypothetical protein bsdtb5_17560 [Anaeromicropila herbilytica]